MLPEPVLPHRRALLAGCFVLTAIAAITASELPARAACLISIEADDRREQAGAPPPVYRCQPAGILQAQNGVIVIRAVRRNAVRVPRTKRRSERDERISHALGQGYTGFAKVYTGQRYAGFHKVWRGQRWLGFRKVYSGPRYPVDLYSEHGRW